MVEILGIWATLLFPLSGGTLLARFAGCMPFTPVTRARFPCRSLHWCQKWDGVCEFTAQNYEGAELSRAQGRAFPFCGCNIAILTMWASDLGSLPCPAICYIIKGSCIEIIHCLCSLPTGLCEFLEICPRKGAGRLKHLFLVISLIFEYCFGYFLFCFNLNFILHLYSSLRKRSSGELSESSGLSLSSTPDPNNLLGLRIEHNWREKGNLTKWKGTVLERLTVNTSLYMVKYDGFDCVYGIELFKDERVSNLQVLTEKVGGFTYVLSMLKLWFKHVGNERRNSRPGMTAKQICTKHKRTVCWSLFQVSMYTTDSSYQGQL